MRRRYAVTYARICAHARKRMLENDEVREGLRHHRPGKAAVAAAFSDASAVPIPWHGYTWRKAHITAPEPETPYRCLRNAYAEPRNNKAQPGGLG